MILSYTLILPILHRQTQQVMTSHIEN